jgi:hypothetical protein
MTPEIENLAIAMVMRKISQDVCGIGFGEYPCLSMAPCPDGYGLPRIGI